MESYQKLTFDFGIDSLMTSTSFKASLSAPGQYSYWYKYSHYTSRRGNSVEVATTHRGYEDGPIDSLAKTIKVDTRRELIKEIEAKEHFSTEPYETTVIFSVQIKIFVTVILSSTGSSISFALKEYSHQELDSMLDALPTFVKILKAENLAEPCLNYVTRRRRFETLLSYSFEADVTKFFNKDHKIKRAKIFTKIVQRPLKVFNWSSLQELELNQRIYTLKSCQVLMKSLKHLNQIKGVIISAHQPVNSKTTFQVHYRILKSSSENNMILLCGYGLPSNAVVMIKFNQLFTKKHYSFINTTQFLINAFRKNIKNIKLASFNYRFWRNKFQEKHSTKMM